MPLNRVYRLSCSTQMYSLTDSSVHTLLDRCVGSCTNRFLVSMCERTVHLIGSTHKRGLVLFPRVCSNFQ